MNKDNYIKSIDEIKASEELKRKTLNKIGTEKKRFRIGYKLVNAVAIVLVVFSILWLSQENKINLHENVFIQEEETVPKIGSYEKLIEILSDRKNQNDDWYLDFAIAESTTQEKKEFSSDISKTNTQVENVDEADVVKTDGEYIYYIARNNLIIVKAQTLEVVNQINYNELKSDNYINVSEIFLYNNKLVVISNKTERIDTDNKVMYDMIAPVGKTYTVAIVYDITDKSNIKVIREVEIEGNYLSARMIEDNVYLIANKYLYLYNTNIEEMQEDLIKPKYRDTANSKEYKSISYDCMYYFPEGEENRYLNIAGFSVENNREASIKSLLGSGNEVYASYDNLYVTNNVYNFKEEFSENKTKIYKFELKRTNVKCVATAEVAGSIINQFSMDERNGYFRIATTTNIYNRNEQKSENNLYVLDEELKTVGKLEGLAKGEKIYSVRFIGDRGYIVTFKQVDPLFVIDLSSPTSPAVLGELKIPGYSEYLHPYDETHIIGFGKDTKETSTGATITGMKMALFDVTNPNEPKQMHATQIGDKYTYSELSCNHKALLFSKEKNIIAFPISKRTSYNTYFRGAVIYGLTLDKGFELRGEIKNDPSNEEFVSNVERIIYIGDKLYTVSNSLIKAVDINTMQEINRVELNIKNNNSYIMY